MASITDIIANTMDDRSTAQTIMYGVTLTEKLAFHERMTSAEIIEAMSQAIPKDCDSATMSFAIRLNAALQK